MIQEKYSKGNSNWHSKKYRHKRKWLSHADWWARKRAEEAKRAERAQWELKRDEQMQSDMIYKDETEAWCEPRFEHINNQDILKLRGGDQYFDALNYLMNYEGCIARLRKHIPNLEYDPRIVHECKFEFLPGREWPRQLLR